MLWLTWGIKAFQLVFCMLLSFFRNRLFYPLKKKGKQSKFRFSFYTVKIIFHIKTLHILFTILFCFNYIFFVLIYWNKGASKFLSFSCLWFFLSWSKYPPFIFLWKSSLSHSPHPILLYCHDMVKYLRDSCITIHFSYVSNEDLLTSLYFQPQEVTQLA